MINPLEVKDWNKRILEYPEYSLFFTSNWVKVLQEAYNYTPKYFVSYNSDEKICTAIPMMEVTSYLTGKRGVSLPFTDFCEPIGNGNFNEVFAELRNYAKSKRWKFLEFRGGNKFFDIIPSSFYFHHYLNLTRNIEEIYSHFHPSNKRNIKKAIKEGIKVEFSDSADALNKFYHLNCITRKRHGLPPQPYSFFKQVYKYIFSEGLGVVSLAYYYKKPIAGAVFFHFGKKALYKFGASEFKYQHLRPNNLIMWETIKYYNAKGFEDFSFGKTEPDNEGLRRFKLAWGSEEEKIFTFKYDLFKDKFIPNPDASKGFHNFIFRIMPVPLLKIVGKTIYRHVG